MAPARLPTFPIVLAGFAAFLDLYATQPLLPLLARTFDASTFQVGLTVTAPVIAVALAAPAVGRLADRVGLRRTILTSAILLTLATALAATARTLPQLIFWRFMQGVVTPGIFASTIAYIHEVWPANRAGRGTASYMSGTVIGGFTGRAVAGVVAADASWHESFIALAMLNGLVALALWKWLPAPKRHETHLRSAERGPSYGGQARRSAERGPSYGGQAGRSAERGPSYGGQAGRSAERGPSYGGQACRSAERGPSYGGQARRSAERGPSYGGQARRSAEHSPGYGQATSLLKTLFTNRRLVATFGVGFCVLFTQVAMFTYVTFLLAAPPYSLSTVALGWLFIVYLVGAAVTPFSGAWVDRYGHRVGIASAMAIGATGALLTLAPSLPAIVAGLALCATGVFIAQATTSGYIGAVTTRDRALAVGVYSTFYYGGGSTGGALPALFWSRGGWPACVALVVTIQAIGTAIAFTQWSERTPAHPEAIEALPPP